MEAVKTRFMRAGEWVLEGSIGKPGLLEADFCLDIGRDPSGRHLGVSRFEVGEASRCLREGLLESLVMSLETSLRMARWLDEILGQSGVGHTRRSGG